DSVRSAGGLQQSAAHVKEFNDSIFEIEADFYIAIFRYRVRINAHLLLLDEVFYLRISQFYDFPVFLSGFRRTGACQNIAAVMQQLCCDEPLFFGFAFSFNMLAPYLLASRIHIQHPEGLIIGFGTALCLAVTTQKKSLGFLSPAVADGVHAHQYI